MNIYCTIRLIEVKRDCMSKSSIYRARDVGIKNVKNTRAIKKKRELKDRYNDQKDKLKHWRIFEWLP